MEESRDPDRGRALLPFTFPLNQNFFEIHGKGDRVGGQGRRLIGADRVGRGKVDWGDRSNLEAPVRRRGINGKANLYLSISVKILARALGDNGREMLTKSTPSSCTGRVRPRGTR